MSHIKTLAEQIVGAIAGRIGSDAVLCAEDVLRQAVVEFALLPVEVDDGEMDTEIGVVSLRLADIDDGFTFVGVQGDLQPGEFEALAHGLEKANKDRRTPRKFLVLNGQIGEKYQLLRVIPKHAYDADFDEEKPAHRAGE